MKNSIIQIRKPRNQNQKSEFWFLSCKPYSQANFQKTIQEIAKKPNLKNWKGIKNLQSLVGQRVSQETKKPKLFNKKFQVLGCSNSLPAYLRWLFLRIVTAPPPYTMESVTTLQVVMEVTNFASSNS